MADERSAVLLDWGGVMTGNLFASFAAFCVAENLDRDALAHLFRRDADARSLLVDFECGRLEELEFEPRLARLLGIAERSDSNFAERSDSNFAERSDSNFAERSDSNFEHEGLIDRLFAGAELDHVMVDGVRALHERGVRTALVSNSWGTRRYPRELLAELFDGVVISGEEGFRKPDPRMYALGAERAGAAPADCVFVDDLAFNLDPARELGMAVVHHTDAASTLAELWRLVS